MNYFKSNYDLGIAYSFGWYGTLDYSPVATILLYDDNQGYCIGYINGELPQDIQLISELEAQIELNNAQNIDGVFFGKKLVHRWDEVVING